MKRQLGLGLLMLVVCMAGAKAGNKDLYKEVNFHAGFETNSGQMET
jgi:hypothetical protein